MRNYYPLEQYLTCANQDTVILSFEEIGKIIGDELPQSALKYHAWWSSPSSHPHAYSWHNAGYKVSVNLIEKKAVFTKSIASSEKRIKSSPFPKTLVKKAPAKAEKPCPIINSATKHITMCGYPFTFIQQLIPNTENGKVIKYFPQNDYLNQRNLPLSKHGAGAFCRFSVDAAPVPGVYLWISNGEIIYIGETKNLSQRFNSGYGSISARNCYIGGQNTNCKMNKVVMDYYERKKTIELYFYETNRYKEVELELLRQYNTRYNVKDN